MRSSVMKAAHTQHLGVVTTASLIQRSCWWPNLFADVNAYIGQCEKCALLRPIKLKEEHTWPDSELWERLHADWAYDEEVGEILVVVDAGSGWIEAFPRSNRATKGVMEALQALFGRFGMPRTFVTDNGMELVAR